MKHSSRAKDGTFNCEWCGKCFAYGKNLSRHQMNFCPRRPSSEATPAESTGRAVSTDPTPPPRTAGFSACVATSHGMDNELSMGHETQQLRKMLMSKYPSSSDDGRRYYCDGCQYVPNCTFTQHVMDIHRGVFVPEMSNVSSPHPGYCERCDITFRSSKNFQIHKHYFCNSRPVYELANSNFQTYVKTLNDIQQRQLRQFESQSMYSRNNLIVADSPSKPVPQDAITDQQNQPVVRTSPVASNLSDVAGLNASTFLTQMSSMNVTNSHLASSARLNADSTIGTLPKDEVPTQMDSAAAKPWTKSSAQIVFLSTQKNK